MENRGITIGRSDIYSSNEMGVCHPRSKQDGGYNASKYDLFRMNREELAAYFDLLDKAKGKPNSVPPRYKRHEQEEYV